MRTDCLLCVHSDCFETAWLKKRLIDTECNNAPRARMRAFDARIAGHLRRDDGIAADQYPRILATPRYGISLFTTTRTRAPTYIYLSPEPENLEAPHGVPFASQAVKPRRELSRQFCGIGIRDAGMACVIGPVATHGISGRWRNRGLAARRAPGAVRRAPGRVGPGPGSHRRCAGLPGVYRSLPGDRAAARC